MRKIFLFLFVILSFFATVYAGIIFLEYSATPSTDKVTIEWKNKPKSLVKKFIIVRSIDDKEFTEIGFVEVNGSENEYKYVDESMVFRGSHVLYYRIRALRSDKSVIAETESLIVTPNISGIYHTWAAIKAMFR